MKRLTIFVIVVAVIYSAYWVIGARTVEQTATTQLAELQADGWDVAYSDLGVQGFPSRFDTTVTDVDVTSPDGKIRYAAPFVQALALSYQPNRVILALPETQNMTLMGQDVVVAADGLRASVAVNANTALSLQDATAEGAQVSVTAPAVGMISFTDFLAALREAGDLPNSYALYLNAQDIVVPDAVFREVLGADLPQTVSVAKADATVVLDRPLDRHTLPAWERDPGRLRGLTLRQASVTWGDLTLSADGEITVDDSGTPEGTITVRAANWEKMLNIAINAGLLPADVRFMAANVGQSLSGGTDDLELPIRFQNGNWAIGPFPLGLAPRF